MQSNIVAMIKQNSDTERMKQSSLSLKRPQGHSIIARMKNLAQGMNDEK